MDVEEPGTGYQLGSDPAELERLNHQGRVLAPASRVLLDAAGIGAGMRVLDLGSGLGDLAFIAADLVGASGSVRGIDRAPEPVARANLRAQQRGLENVRFVVGDVREPAPDGPYDAVIGRLVLMHVSDPVAVIRTQAGVLRPGGVVVPIEIDFYSAHCVPPTPLMDKVTTWLDETYRRSGIDAAIGPRLWQILREAGLRPAGMLGVQPHFGPGDPDGAAILGGIVRTLLPLMERTGVATAAEVGPDTFQERLRDELAAAGAVLAHPTLVSASATIDQQSLP